MQITIQTSPAGVQEVVVKSPRGQRPQGIDFLLRLLPAIRRLDEQARETEPRGAGQ